MFVGWFFSSVRNFIYPSWPVRIAFHLGEDEDPRFELASRISAARPGPKPRRCGGADRKGIREGGPGLGLRRRDAGRMPRGASRDCLRPRKPLTPPAAAEASQWLRIATAAAAALLDFLKMFIRNSAFNCLTSQK